MKISFIRGSPALMIKTGRILVASDLHIGNEFKLARSGIHFTNATKRMAQDLLETYKKNRARRLVLLGDIKESIGYPPREEFEAIASFFHAFRDIDVSIVRGNHDAHLSEILKRIGISLFPVNELIIDGIALLHGNGMPSEAAMKKDYIIAGHSHIAVNAEGRASKGWLVAGAGKGAPNEYARFNKRIKLIVMPAYNSLITGVSVNDRDDWTMPLFRRKVFNASTAKAYDLNGKLRWRGTQAARSMRIKE
jgi:metallophosphoesterase superfamily enzyme